MDNLHEKSEQIRNRIAEIMSNIDQMLYQNELQKNRLIKFQNDLQEIKRELKQIEVSNRKHKLSKFNFLNNFKNFL